MAAEKSNGDEAAERSFVVQAFQAAFANAG
jgi:hypothetical protein